MHLPAPSSAARQASFAQLIAYRQRALLGLLAVLAGCSSTPQRPADPIGPLRPAAAGQPPTTGLPPAPEPGRDSRDGPGANPPPDLLATPDAEPRVEAMRSGGPNKPYEALGQPYTPLTGDPPLVQRGLASWYGRKFHGRSTANGETYNMYAMTAAHKTMPLPSYARVRNPANGREVVVRVNDRGPFIAGRVIDLSYTAALKLGVLAGVAPVEIERITYEAIRAGSWRTPADLASLAEPSAALGSKPLPAIASASASATATATTSAPPPPPVPAPAPTPAPTATDAALAQVRPEAPAQAAVRAARGFWLQLGAFALRDGAMGFQQRVAQEASWLAPMLTIFTEQSLHRLQAGPYASRRDARQAAERLRDALNLVPALVERR